MKARAERANLPVTRKLVLAAVAVALAWGLLEVLFALGGTTPLSTRADPFLGFSSWSRVFEVQGGVVRVRQAHRKLLPLPEFRTPKPAGTLRVFVFGGSTAEGYPMGRQAAFARWMETGLTALYPGRKVEVLNLALGSYGTYRIRQLAREAALYEPDAFVVYAGNNEFLEKRFFRRSRELSEWTLGAIGALGHSYVYSAVSDLVARLRGAPVTPPDPFLFDPLSTSPLEKDKDRYRDLDERDQIVQFYGKNLEDIADVCRDAGCRTVLCTLPVNLLGTGPTLSDPIAEQAVLDQALELERAERFEEALALFTSLTGANRENAFLLYHIGVCQHRLGRLDQAREALTRSLAFDRYPQRVLPEQNALIRRLAERADVALCDLEQVFAATVPGGIHGNDLFLDAMHLTPEAHKRAALEVVRTMSREGLIEAAGFDEARFLAALDAAPTGEMEATLASRLFFLGQTYLRQGNHQKAAEHFERAIADVPDRPEYHSNLGVARAELGDLPGATAAFAKAVELRPQDADTRANLGLALARQGRTAEAEAALREALGRDPRLVRASIALAQALRSQNRVAEAHDVLRAAVEHAPDDVALQDTLGVTEVQLGRPAEAEARFRKVLQLKPGHLPSTLNLAVLLRQAGRFDEALALLVSAGQLSPHYAPVPFETGLVHLGANRPADALAPLRKAVRLAPNEGRYAHQLAVVLLRQGQPEEAKRLLAEAVARTRDPNLIELQRKLMGP